jgi:hypothetical protein
MIVFTGSAHAGACAAVGGSSGAAGQKEQQREGPPAVWSISISGSIGKLTACSQLDGVLASSGMRCVMLSEQLECCHADEHDG